MPSSDSLTAKAFWGTFWSAVDAFAKQGISFIIGLVLARLLFPSDYGLIGMLSIFIALSQSFIDCGFSNALICKKNRTDDDWSTAFVFNLVIGIAAYGVLFLISPLVAKFYDEPLLVPLLRVIGLNVVFNSLCIVQTARLTVELRIRVQTFISVICQLTTGFIAIILAYKGFGVWALALQSTSSSLLTTVLLWYSAHWTPRLHFSKESFRYLWGFGSKMLCVGLISTTYKNIYSVIVGKYFNRENLGYYTKAQSLSDLFPKLVYAVINKVSLPTLAAINDDNERLKFVFRRYMQITAFIVFPIVGLLIVLAEPLILFLWTERWSNCIVLFQILCLGSMWDPFNLFSLNIMQVIKRPDVTLRLELINKIVGTVIILSTIPFGLMPFICGRAFYNFYEYAVNINCTRKYIGYRLIDQIGDLYAYIILTIVEVFVVRMLLLTIHSSLLQILVGGICGVGIYLIMAFVFKVEALSHIKTIYNRVIN